MEVLCKENALKLSVCTHGQLQLVNVQCLYLGVIPLPGAGWGLG